MSDPSEIRVRLAALIETGTLPRSAVDAARQLLDRFDAPARVTFLGLPGSGRARLLNLVAGDQVLPEGRPLPTLSLHHGGVARTVGTLANGEQASWPGLPIDAIDEAGAMFLDLTRPLPALREFTLLELSADETADDQVAAMRWAEERTDIALWVSRGFTAAEAALWSRAPDSMRDNGYLVMTGATPPAARIPGFRSAFHVERDDTLAPLLAELRACAARGREGLLDHALLLLARFEDRKPSQMILRQAHTASVIDMGQASDRVRTMQRPVPPPPVPTPAAGPDVLQIRSQAVAYLRTRAAELDKLIDSLAELPEKRVLGFCLETVEELVEKVSALDEPDPTLADIEEMVLEAADVIMLLQSEDGIEPATDAITLLLQLRRDLEARVAA
jgi:hypothetical protein